jgi:hypothetical protein
VAGFADLWCRVEEDGDCVRRINVMHPNGEILFSFLPERFDQRLIRQISAGQVRARVVDETPGTDSTLEFLDEAGQPLFRETVEARSNPRPEDDAER